MYFCGRIAQVSFKEKPQFNLDQIQMSRLYRALQPLDGVTLKITVTVPLIL